MGMYPLSKRKTKLLETERKQAAKEYLCGKRHDEYARDCAYFDGPLSEKSDEYLAEKYALYSGYGKEESEYIRFFIYAEQVKRM